MPNLCQFWVNEDTTPHAIYTHHKIPILIVLSVMKSLITWLCLQVHFKRFLGTCFDKCKYRQRGKEGIRMQHFVMLINTLEFFKLRGLYTWANRGLGTSSCIFVRVKHKVNKFHVCRYKYKNKLINHVTRTHGSWLIFETFSQFY